MRKLILLATAGLAGVASLAITPASAFNCHGGGYGYSAGYSGYGYSQPTYAPQRRIVRKPTVLETEAFDGMTTEQIVTMLGGMQDDTIRQLVERLSDKQIAALKGALEEDNAAPTTDGAAPAAQTPEAIAPQADAPVPEIGADAPQRIAPQAPRASIGGGVPVAARAPARPQQFAAIDPQPQRLNVEPQRVNQGGQDPRVQRFNAPPQAGGQDPRVQRFNAPPQAGGQDPRIQRIAPARGQASNGGGDDPRIQRIAPRISQNAGIPDQRVQRFNAPRGDQRVQRFNIPNRQVVLQALNGRRR